MFCHNPKRIQQWSSRLIQLFLLVTVWSQTARAGATCHGPIGGIRYRYHYHTSLTLNNQDNFEPAGFELDARFAVQNLWQNKQSYLLLIESESLQFKPRANVRSFQFTAGPTLTDWPQVLAQVDGQTGKAMSLYVPKSTSQHHLEPTQMNLIVSLIGSLRNRFDSNEKVSYQRLRDGQTFLRKSELHDTSSEESLLAPQIIDHWEISSYIANDHDIAEHVSGWQNVSFGSKIYPSAHSNLAVEFDLKLTNEDKSPLSYDGAQSVQQAVEQYGQQHKKSLTKVDVHMIGERKPCQPHLCDSLGKFISDYQKQLSENSLATNALSGAYLKFINFFRINSDKIQRKEVLKLLQKYYKSTSQDGNVYVTLLDVIAGSRHGEAMLAAMDFLDLTKCKDAKVNDCERFLVTIAISASTTSNMGNSYVAEHSLSTEQLLDLFIPLIKGTQWADDRVKHAYALTLATLMHSYRTFAENVLESSKPHYSSLYVDTLIVPHSSSLSDFVVDEQQNDDSVHRKPINRVKPFSEKVIKYLIHELDACKDTECRIVYLHSIGNARIITKYGVLHVLKKYAINSGKRESVAAMKAMRDCIALEFRSLATEVDGGGNVTISANYERQIVRLRQLLLRVVYDSSLETTSRLIAAELLATYIDKHGDITYELVQHLETFPSELATMIWKRAVQIVRSRTAVATGSRYTDWNLHSKILSGSSASFRYVMGGTGYANASYGVLLELIKGKLPKESSFKVDLSSGPLTQDVINVGLFARGLQSFAGESEDDEQANEIQTDDDDSTLAGMTLQVLGNQLRPFLFFSSSSELMGHLWSGAASDPTSVFRGNLFIADYLELRPLINGFLVEQSLMGVFSVDLTGEIQVSLWNRNSHSVVQTMGSILFQGSQQIFTTDRRTSARKYFSFGAESKLNFITDFDFYSSPYRICIQITQPEFVFKHNTRKYEQVHSENLHRRIHRRSYKIPAKSYVLNRDNSKMCASMNADSD